MLCALPFARVATSFNPLINPLKQICYHPILELKKLMHREVK